MRYKDDTFMKVAELFSKNSYCKRAKVGAVLVMEERILATAYNGTLSGRNNCCENITLYCTNCGWASDDCTIKKCGNCGSPILTTQGLNKTKDEVLHAEQNLISFCAKNGISTKGTIMYITMSPCSQCAKLIASSGIKEVVYKDIYRDTTGIELLKEYGIKVRQYKLNKGE